MVSNDVTSLRSPDHRPAKVTVRASTFHGQVGTPTYLDIRLPDFLQEEADAVVVLERVEEEDPDACRERQTGFHEGGSEWRSWSGSERLDP